jgi:hypothetical protein
VLLIRALHGLDDESLNRVYYTHAEQPAALWEVPQGGHTGALAVLPQQYEARVVGFFDHALRAADQRHRPGLRTHETEAP